MITLPAKTTTAQAPEIPEVNLPLLPVTADPTLVPQHVNFQMIEPVLKQALERIEDIATRARNATDTLMEQKPHEAQKFMFHELRAQKLILETITKYSELALEARKVVSTDKPDTPKSVSHVQNNVFLGEQLPPEMESVFSNILGRKQVVNSQDVSTRSLEI